jgi:hypothetical protein
MAMNVIKYLMEKLAGSWALLVLPVIISGCSSEHQTELKNKWPDMHMDSWKYKVENYDDAPIREGYVVTRYSDTVKGYVKLVPSLVGVPNADCIAVLPYGKNKFTDMINVKKADIAYVKLRRPLRNPDNIDRLSGSVNDIDVYVPFTNNELWLFLGIKGGAKIYYNFYITGYGNIQFHWEMCLVTHNQQVKIPIHLPAIHPRAYYLVQFLNKRYNQRFKTSDFKGEKAVIDYILDQENGVQGLKSAAM